MQEKIEILTGIAASAFMQWQLSVPWRVLIKFTYWVTTINLQITPCRTSLIEVNFCACAYDFSHDRNRYMSLYELLL